MESIVCLFLFFFFCVISFFAVFSVYFLPFIIAYLRKHTNIIPVFIMNVFLGWTFFGWIAALLWSLNSDVKKEETTLQAESECN